LVIKAGYRPDMKGKVIDKGSNTPIPGVLVFLTDSVGEYVENAEGYAGTKTNSKGVYEYSLAPGQYLSFEMTGYPRTIRSYDQLSKKSTIVLNDASGSALEKKEVNAFMSDMRKTTNGQWLVGIGLGLFLIVIVLILAKKLGWF